jgi:hypothetical protein
LLRSFHWPEKGAKTTPSASHLLFPFLPDMQIDHAAHDYEAKYDCQKSFRLHSVTPPLSTIHVETVENKSLFASLSPGW